MLNSGRPGLSPCLGGSQLFSQDTCSLHVQLRSQHTPQPRLPGTHFGSSIPSSSFTQLPLAAQRYCPGITQGTQVTQCISPPFSILCKAPLDTDEGTTSHQLEKNLHPGMMVLASNPVLRRWKQDDPGQPLLHRKGKATLGYVKLHFKK